jgi:hypothetical protein
MEMSRHVATTPRVDEIALLAVAGEPERRAIESDADTQQLERRRGESDIEVATGPCFQSGNLGLGGSEAFGKFLLTPPVFGARDANDPSDLTTDVQFDVRNDHCAIDTSQPLLAG